jgi:LmbE family N-acetylglucosaminyl deacetylase
MTVESAQAQRRLPDPLDDEPLLVLAPHCDDAALSCAALIARARPIEVLTVFAGEPEPPRRSSWDRTTGFVDSAASVATRRAEERAAFADTPHTLRFLELLEGEYLDAPRPRADADAITAAAAAWLDAHPNGIVAVPAGAGVRPGRLRATLRRLVRRGGRLRHPDHVVVRDAGLDAALAAGRARQALLYEDFPYSWAQGADDEVRRVVRSRRAGATPLVVSVDRDEKATRIARYGSQVPHLREAGRRVDLADDVPPHERYWLLVADEGSR